MSSHCILVWFYLCGSLSLSLSLLWGSNVLRGRWKLLTPVFSCVDPFSLFYTLIYCERGKCGRIGLTLSSVLSVCVCGPKCFTLHSVLSYRVSGEIYLDFWNFILSPYIIPRSIKCVRLVWFILHPVLHTACVIDEINVWGPVCCRLPRSCFNSLRDRWNVCQTSLSLCLCLSPPLSLPSLSPLHDQRNVCQTFILVLFPPSLSLLHGWWNVCHTFILFLFFPVWAHCMIGEMCVELL